jgi:tetratricopeptide (TPR) repeat protein
VSGDVVMGDIKLQGNKYVVMNLEWAKGRSFDMEDVLDGGFSADVKIPATVMKAPLDVLKIAEEQRSPLENARQFYELARIADRMGLYEEAKDYVTLALAASPDKAMQTTLETYNGKLDELIRQRDLLNALAEARKAAGKHIYQLALNALNDAKKKYNPTGEVLEKFDETYTEIDTDYSSFIVTEWYKLMPAVARKKASTKNLTWQEARNWALKEMEVEIKAAIAIKTGGDQNDIKARFVKRDKEKLTLRKISFGETGFYDVVGGPLQSAGVKAGQTGQPGANPSNPGAPRGTDRPRGPSGNGPGSNNGSIEPGSSFDDDQDGLQPKKEGGELPPLPPDAEEYLRKIKEAYDKQQADKAKAGAAQDLSKFKIPTTYQSIDDWWKEQSRITKQTWMVAIYVRFAGTMYFEQELQDLKYK